MAPHLVEIHHLLRAERAGIRWDTRSLVSLQKTVERKALHQCSIPSIDSYY